MWLVVLSDQLPIAALVGRYPANKLIGRRLLRRRIAALGLGPYAVLAPVSRGCPPPPDIFLRVAHPSATPRCQGVRLACVKHSASVRSEPGSNSQVHRARPDRSPASQMPLDRAPLATLDAERLLEPEPRTDTAPSRDSTGRQGRKHSLASKRQMRLSKIGPLGRHEADEETTPRRRGAKNGCPKARRSGSQPHGPRPPNTTASSPEDATD